VEGLLLFVHIVVSLLLVIVVLLQSGKSADLAGAFGGGGTQSSFGPRGTATILSKVTTILAVSFMITSLLLYITATNKVDADTVLTTGDTETAQKLPAAGGEKDKPVTEKKTEDKKEEKKEEKKDNSDSNQ